MFQKFIQTRCVAQSQVTYKYPGVPDYYDSIYPVASSYQALVMDPENDGLQRSVQFDDKKNVHSAMPHTDTMPKVVSLTPSAATIRKMADEAIKLQESLTKSVTSMTAYVCAL